MPIDQLIARHIDARGKGAQSALARLLNVGQPQVSRWRRGETIPEMWRADQLADALGLAADYVEAAIVEAQRARSAERRAPPSDDQKVVERIRALESEVGRLRRLVEGLAADEPPGRRPSGR